MHSACTNSKCELRPSCGRAYLSVRSIWARPVRLPTGELTCGWKIDKEPVSHSMRVEREVVMAALEEASHKLVGLYTESGRTLETYRECSEAIVEIINKLATANNLNQKA